MTTTPTDFDALTHEDVAPYLGRVLLAVATDDDDAFFAAIIDAASEGVDATAILVLTAQALTLHLDHANPAWQAEVRRGLLEGASDE